jgi:selenocysteine lyase/cysteine desulfurase
MTVAETERRVGAQPAPVSRADVVGGDLLVPVIGGAVRRYVNLDNAASTPALRAVADAIAEFLPFYSGVHRGTGYKSRVSTAAFERARQIVGDFVGADPERDVVVFTKNSTESINKLAGALVADPEAVVLTTMLEHHSDDLPWRPRFRTVHVELTPDGTLDLAHLDELLARHAGHVALLAVSGASNVTGVVQPVHDLAAMVHAAGGRILVDAAQLAPHRRIDMRAHDDPGHLDAVVLSAHKLYAPFGTGVLIAARDSFAEVPRDAGGGTVRAVTPDTVAWADLPDREEAGSPNVVGAVALAVAVTVLDAVGLDRIAEHERALTDDALTRLEHVAGVRLYGPAARSSAARSPATDRVGVVAFTIDAIDHGLIAAVLGYEHGIGVRNGCFCAHPYLAHLLGLDRTRADAWVTRAAAGDKRGGPGLVRLSIGCYNDATDIDRLIDGVEQLVGHGPGADYRIERDGSFHPHGYDEADGFVWRSGAGVRRRA